jgi:CheY-like chemotaxis protein
MKKILIVDDSSMFRMAIINEFKDQEFDLYQVENGQGCIDIVLKHSGQFDLIILDLVLPDKTGFEVCKELSELPFEAAIKVIFLTSNDTVENRQKGLSLGALDFIPKNFVAGELQHRVKEILYPDSYLAQFTALVVDDSKLARQITCGFLEDFGIQYIECESGVEAIEKLKENPSRFDIVLTDQIMPEMDGVQMSQAIRRELGLRNIPIILLSANPDRKVVLDGYNAGINDFLSKPFFKEEFISRIKSLLERKLIGQLKSDEIKQLKEAINIKNHFLAATSHDFRSPLQGISGLVKILKEDLEKDNNLGKEHLDYIDIIIDTCDGLYRLSDTLLDFGKMKIEKEDLEFSLIEINSVIHTSLSEQGAFAKQKSVDLDYSTPQEKIKVWGNSNALLRIINNLLSNSIKFSPRGKPIKLNLSQDSESISLEMRDHGVGFSEDQMKEILKGRPNQTTLV